MKKMSRRNFSKKVALTAAMAPIALNSFATSAFRSGGSALSGLIRLGGPVYKDEWDSPDTWIQAIKKNGYGAINCPLTVDADDATVNAYKEAARKADIFIAEVGAWSNPISPDDAARKAAMEKCISSLDLADRIEARCCVNVSGSRGTESFAGPHPDNMTPETFDMIVECTRKIIDAVKPTRTFYCLEDMPWAYPDSADSYLELIKAIDRKQLAVHYDPVNLVCSPQKYYNSGAMIREDFKKLGKYLRSCHAKDTLLSTKLTTHLDEVVPGVGNLDYAVYLKELSKLDNVPMMMEHMKREEYPVAAAYIRKVGKENGLEFKV